MINGSARGQQDNGIPFEIYYKRDEKRIKELSSRTHSLAGILTRTGQTTGLSRPATMGEILQRRDKNVPNETSRRSGHRVPPENGGESTRDTGRTEITKWMIISLIFVMTLVGCAGSGLRYNSYQVHHGDVYMSPSMVPLIYYSARF